VRTEAVIDSNIVCRVVGITLLLSMTVFQLIIADKVPESSQGVPLVGMPINSLTIVKHPLALDSDILLFMALGIDSFIQ